MICAHTVTGKKKEEEKMAKSRAKKKERYAAWTKLEWPFLLRIYDKSV